MNNEPDDTFTLATPGLYNGMTPKEQGYIACLQAGMTGNTLPEKCPYPSHKTAALQWQRGWKKASRKIETMTPVNDA